MNAKTFDRIIPWCARAALVVGAVVLFSGTAKAGECPASRVQKDAMAPGAMKPVGVTDDVIASIDLARKSVAFKGENFRMRRLVVEPGGEVPWHSHGKRPAIIFMVQGSITEYRSNCSEPIEHRTGEVVAEFGADLKHWWRNNGKEPAILISADILHDDSQDKHSM